MQRTWVVVLAIAAGVALIILSITTSGEHRYWPWLALLALGGRAAVAVYALLARRRG
jgi:drug/metabolite transporter (DMT)-like permease